MEPTRDRITKTLRDHSADVEFGQAPVPQILAAGHRLRRRRVALTSAASVAAVVAIAGIGWALGEAQLSGDGDTAVPAEAPTSAVQSSRTSEASTDGDGSASESEGSATPAPPAGVELTACADIPRFPSDSIDDYTVDAESGILTFGYPTDTDERMVNIAYERDEGCRDHPDVSRLITLLEGLGAL